MHSTDIEVVIDAAQRHGEDSEPDHEVGDLQDMLRLAWGFMSHEMRDDFMAHDTVKDLLSENPGSDDVPAEEAAHRSWQPAHNEESGMYYLVRALPGGLSHGAEVKRKTDGTPEVFHTNFKALRRANDLNRED